MLLHPYRILRDLYLLLAYKRYFGSFKGTYLSYESASKRLVRSWDNASDNQYEDDYNLRILSEEKFEHVITPKKSINSAGLFSWDYPVLFWFTTMFQGNEDELNVIDFGGNLGYHYHSYIKKMGLDIGKVTWTVVELDRFVDLGRRLNKRYSNLHFDTIHSLDTLSIDVFHASSSIQYLDMSILQLLNELPVLPEVVILNRTPFSERASFYTVQNGGSTEYVMRVVSFQEIDELLSLYSIRDEWYDNIDKCKIPFNTVEVFYKGYILKKKRKNGI